MIILNNYVEKLKKLNLRTKLAKSYFGVVQTLYSVDIAFA